MSSTTAWIKLKRLLGDIFKTVVKTFLETVWLITTKNLLVNFSTTTVDLDEMYLLNKHLGSKLATQNGANFLQRNTDKRVLTITTIVDIKDFPCCSCVIVLWPPPTNETKGAEAWYNLRLMVMRIADWFTEVPRMNQTS